MYPVESREIQANGLHFHVATCGDASSRKLALCLHGFPELGYSWRHQLPILAEQGYLAWAPDLRGYGRSERPRAMKDYAIELLMEDVGQLIDVSAADSTVLLAHDWGGVIAWQFALHRVRQRDRLVVMNLPHPAVVASQERNFRQLLRSWYILFFQLPWLPEFLLGLGGAKAIGDGFRNMAVNKERFPDEVLEVYRSAARQPGALRAMVNYYRAYVRGGGARRQRELGYPRIEIPTLLIWGEQDVALGRELTYGTDEHVADLTLRYLPNASHWVQQDDPETVNAMLTEWLQELPVSEASQTRAAG